MKVLACLAFFAAGVAVGWMAAIGFNGVVTFVAGLWGGLGLIAAELDRCKPDPRDPIA